MALPRFYQPTLPTSGIVELDSTEAQHASNALRMSAGDEAVLFDGRGGEALARVETISRKQVCFSITSRTDQSRELACQLDMLVALPKGDRQKTLVEGLVQLGARSLTPIACHRSVAKANTKAIERLKRWAIEASKQCGRNQLMDVRSERAIADLDSEAEEKALRVFAHPYPLDGFGLQAPSLFSDLARAELAAGVDTKRIQVLVGPEGGFTREEALARAENGWKPCSLGPRILRVEMAAISVAAQVGMLASLPPATHEC